MNAPYSRIVAAGLVVVVLAACGDATPSPPVKSTSAQVVPASSQPSLATHYVTTFGANGLPGDLGGEAVLDADAALRAATSGSAPTTFLVGGWTRGAWLRRCPPPAPSSPPRPVLDPYCRPGYSFADWPEQALASPLNAHLFNLTGVSLPTLGATVLRVHLDKAMAAQCPPDLLDECRSTLVIDSVVWTGPGMAAGEPTLICDAPSLDVCNQARGPLIDALRNFAWPVQSIRVTVPTCPGSGGCTPSPGVVGAARVEFVRGGQIATLELRQGDGEIAVDFVALTAN